jgi:hypothetical protein
MNYLTLKEAASQMNEKNDCSVKAVAVVTGKEYPVAHQMLQSKGRRHGLGASSGQIDASIRDLGFRVEEVLVSSRTVRTLEKELRVRFSGHKVLVYVRRHVLGWDGEKIQDWTEGRQQRVKKVYLVSPINQQIPTPQPTTPPQQEPQEPRNLLSAICQELGVEPQVARRKLRKAGLRAPYTDEQAIRKVLFH